MTPPTIQEFAGIFMLALLTAGLITHPSTGTQAAPAEMMSGSTYQMNSSYIDGIETIALSAPCSADNAKAIESDSALHLPGF